MTFFDGWGGAFPDLLRGLVVSLRITVASLAIGLLVGLLLAIITGGSRSPLRALVIVLVEIGRGMPALVMLQVVYFGLPSLGWLLSSYWSASLALGLTTAAYTSEIIRGGLQSVPQGEVEAARALSMSRADVLRYIVLPQGLRVALPSLMGFAILIFQGTSLAYSVAMPELFGTAKSIGSSTFRYLSIFTLAGLLYAAITIPTALLSERVERRLSRHV